MNKFEIKKGYNNNNQPAWFIDEKGVKMLDRRGEGFKTKKAAQEWLQSPEGQYQLPNGLKA